MNENNPPTETSSSGLRRVVAVALPILVLAISVVFAVMVLKSKPTAERAKPQDRAARLVTVTPAEIAPPTIMLSANGSVEAAEATDLRARVSGQINWLADKLAPGTRFKKGEALARIDAADYRLALANAKTELDGALASLRVEEGQLAVAKRELDLVGSDISSAERDLVLRGPQLEQARGAVAAARNQVAQAQLNLDRTTVRAPYAGIITARNASLGNVISPSDSLATLAATDAYWVNAAVPVDQLRWLRARNQNDNQNENDNGEGSAARVYYPDAWPVESYLPAEVLRVAAALEANGRMARVILRVPEPLGDGSSSATRLILGAYVQAKLEADVPAQSVVIDSAFLRENDQVWTMTPDNKLDIHSVEVIYRDSVQAVIGSGLAAGDAVVTSELTAPIQGMPLRVEATAASSAQGEAAGQESGNTGAELPRARAPRS